MRCGKRADQSKDAETRMRSVTGSTKGEEAYIGVTRRGKGESGRAEEERGKQRIECGQLHTDEASVHTERQLV